MSCHRLYHWYIFIYKAILCLLPSYLLTYIHQKCVGRALEFAAPSSCNHLQNQLKLEELVLLHEYTVEQLKLLGCNYFRLQMNIITFGCGVRKLLLLKYRFFYWHWISRILVVCFIFIFNSYMVVDVYVCACVPKSVNLSG